MNIETKDFTEARSTLRFFMKRHGKPVRTERWQGQDVRENPAAETRELMHVTVRTPLYGTESLDHWRQEIAPNLPWADEHFHERVGGRPLNPPPSWVRWPWAQSANRHRTEGAATKFNHTYPERYWPKNAGDDVRAIQGHFGIRQEYGDLGDVVAQLVDEPHTRQAYLPVYFPEDTGHVGTRKPCTLGYQFFMRNNELDCFYPMRSCDLLRHYQDDVYLTVRLMLWVLEQARARDGAWDRVTVGTLIMHMTSLHVFVNDVRQL